MTDISDDAPLRLRDAVTIAFPFGVMPESGLRQEHAKGRLNLELLAGKHFVTMRAIREMRVMCEAVPPTYGKLLPRTCVIALRTVTGKIGRSGEATDRECSRLRDGIALAT